MTFPNFFSSVWHILMSKNMKVERETQNLLDAITEFCLEVNAEKTKCYIFMSRHRIAGQHNNMYKSI
jgi:hypothetical protein